MTGVSTVPREARPYQGKRAGVVTRSIAGAADLVVVVIVMIAAYAGWATALFLARPRSFTFPDTRPSLAGGIGYLVLTLYLAVAWASTGRTYGKRVMGLRVINRRGERMRPLPSLLRAILCVAFPIGLLWAAVSSQNRSLQDILLRTSVVHDWSTQRPGRHPPPSS